MTEEEKLLEALNEVLYWANELSNELQVELQDIENPKIQTNIGKQQVIERMRLVNSVIFTGEKAKESLEVQQRKRTRRKG